MVRGGVILLAMARLASAEPRLVVGDSPACETGDFAGRVAALVGRSPFGDGPVAVRIEVARDGEAFVARIIVGDDARTRAIAADTCDQLLDKMALIVAMALPDDDVSPSASPPVAATSRGDDLLQVSSARVTPAIQSMEVDALAGVELSTARAGAFVVGGRIRRGDGELALELAVSTLSSIDIGPMSGVDVRTAALTASPCMHFGRGIASCALVSLGIADGSPHGLMAETDAFTPTVAIGGRFAWEQPLNARTGVRIHVDALGAVEGARFTVDHVAVWSTSGLAAWLGIDLFARFP